MITALAALASVCGVLPATALETPQLRVLFLGDDDIHKPAERFKILAPVLAEKRIELVYTDDMRDVCTEKLAGFDALAIYANITELGLRQEKAMLDFVASGGGLVAIHSASYCFLNSPEYIGLVGAQFKRHGSGVFRETIVDADHPVMEGLSAIESWDETYVHTRHNPDRTVLSERRDDKGNEPWTWVREHGNGRVFYTAWGHDERTWSNAGFQALIGNAVRWTTGKSPSRLRPREGLAPFEFMEAPDAMPNYTPGEKWGTEGEQIRTMQKPLEPGESAKHWVTLPGFEHHLFASEPDIFKPIWLAFDARGRLWIAETKDYPNEMQPENMGRDRLKIVEDSDGDGKADKFTVFADKLSIPTGFVFANDGVIVIHSGRTEHFRDTDGDDRADEAKILFTGWGTRDTHATASNLRYGFDNWIWGTVGYSGFEGTVGGETHRFGQGIFRFKPDGSAMEFIRSTNNNTWGLALTEDNIVIGSTANGNASMYLPIPNRYYEDVNGWSAVRLESIADSQNFYPITDKVRQVDWHGRYTAGSGSGLYTARSFPQAFWNRAQFVAEPTGHLQGLFFLERRGADFVAHNARNFAASDDEWSSPIYAEPGPDGAMWMVDWYNYIIQHNPTPVGFETGRGNAYETPLRDKVHGRIYRITHKDGKPSHMPVLSADDPDGLVAALRNDNMFWRMHAQRLLVERGASDVVPALTALVSDSAQDAIGLNPAATHALWTLHALGAADAPAVDSLENPAAGVRRAALAVLPRTESSSRQILGAGMLADSDAQVRLAALLALAEMPADEDAGEAIAAMLVQPENAGERWILDAAVAAGARNDAAFLRAALAREETPEPLAAAVALVTRHYAQRAPVDSLMATLGAVKEASPEAALLVLDGLVAGWPEDRAPALDAGNKETLKELMEALPDSVQDRLLNLTRRWGQADLFAARFASIVATLRQTVLNPEADDAGRTSAAQRWVALQDTPETTATILGQIALLTPPDLAGGLLTAVAQSNADTVGSQILARWAELTPAVKRGAINALMRRPQWTLALLEAVDLKDIPRGDLAPEHWSQLQRNPSRRVARLAERLAEATPATSEERREIVERLLPLAREKGDAGRGKEVFTASCAVCHQFNGQGGNVGPDLTGIGARDRTEILQEILDPNRSVEANYRLWTVTTASGDVFAGRLEAETQTTVEILDLVAQKHVIQRKDIKGIEVSPLSLMPAAFDALPADDLKGLLEYLMQKQG